MRIRAKLLLLLLSITLIPLVAVTLLANRATYRLGKQVGTGAREALVRRAEQRLRLLVKSKAELLGREGKLIELALRLQATEVERRLRSADVPEIRTFYSEDFDRGVYPPSNLTTSQQYAQVLESGDRKPIPMTLSDQGFKLAPGVSEHAVSDDVRRLASMTPFLRDLYQEYADIFLWQYTGLDNGVHTCYPGHGGYPPDYDHRKRIWYVRAKTEGGFCWSRPYIDVSTRQPVLTASMPVRGRRGEIVGVTAIDVALPAVVARGDLPKRRSSVTALVTLVPKDSFDPSDPGDLDVSTHAPDQLGLLTLARSVDGQTETHWKAPYQLTWITSEDREEFARMLRDMAAGRSAVRKMPYKGRSSLWAHGSVWRGSSHFLAIVPYDEVVEQAARAEQGVLSLTYSQLRSTGAALAVASLVVFVLAYLGARSVTEPLRHLLMAATRIARGDLDARADVKRRDELGELAQTFNDMVPQLRDRMRMKQSLALAMEIQQRLLPAGPPDMQGLDVSGRSVYCDETGGDYYDFLDLSALSTHELGVAVGDVSGHGIPAALLMTAARTLLRDRAAQLRTPSELMAQINERLTADSPPGQFMTLLYMVVNTQDRTVRWTSAGHEPPMIYDPTQRAFADLPGGGVALGIAGGWDYEQHHRGGLAPGSLIVIGTDGIWETRDAEGRFFGVDAFKDVLVAHAEESASAICDAVLAALERFRRGSPQTDDVTLVVVKLPEG